MDMKGFESLALMYVIENPNLFKYVQPNFFTDKYLRGLFLLSLSFYEEYKAPIINMNNINTLNIVEYLKFNEEKVLFHLTDDELDEEKIKNFKESLKFYVTTDYLSYDNDYIKTTTEAWIQWSNFTNGLVNAIKYQKMQVIKPNNVKSVLNKCMNIIMGGAGIDIKGEEAKDFYDPETHKQPAREELIPTGYPVIDKWLGGGLEKGTSTLVYAGTNVGKSILLINLGLNMSMAGYNVFAPSLEMATHRMARRGGANAFNISMDDYDEIANNQEFFKKIMDDWKTRRDELQLSTGKYYMKRFSKATIWDIATEAKMLEDKLGIKWDVILPDYFTELESAYGIPPQNSYMYHRLNSKDFFDVGVQNDWAMVSAHQIKIELINVDDMSLENSGESKGIAFKTDNIIGQIQTPEMKSMGAYVFKALKLREGTYKDYKTILEIDYSKMRITSTGREFDPYDHINEFDIANSPKPNEPKTTKINMGNGITGFEFEI